MSYNITKIIPMPKVEISHHNSWDTSFKLKYIVKYRLFANKIHIVLGIN